MSFNSDVSVTLAVVDASFLPISCLEDTYGILLSLMMKIFTTRPRASKQEGADFGIRELREHHDEE